MKCPKCSYLGFERVDRCRNCGYDFSLSAHSPEPDFTIRRETESDDPPADLSLRDTRTGPDLDRLFGEAEPELEPVGATVVQMTRAAVAERPRPAVRDDLPLFGPPIPDDEPLITRASPPRPPLAVRRATPEMTRLRAESQLRTPSFDLEAAAEATPVPVAKAAARAIAAVNAPAEDLADAAGVGSRLFAVAVDTLILAVIDLVVIYFTMQLCYLTIDDVGLLPKGPLVAFLLVQNGGYLVAFTAGGQTLGKMMAGIRVVQTEAGDPLDLGRAFLRTLMWVALAVPAGLGFVTALFSRDHRGLHDRFAGTRVVRASA